MIHLLHKINVGINFDQIENKNDKDIFNSFYYFSKQIIYIHLDYNSLLNIKLFSNLRSLILYLPTRNQLLSIKSIYFPKLSRLYLGIINKKDQNILNKILFGYEQFSKLNFCNLFQINLNENLYLNNNFNSIR